MASVAIDRLDGLSSSAAYKGPCKVATTANITLSGEQTIDGVSVVEDDRVLVKDQTDAKENGIWVAAVGDWRRAKDFSNNKDVVRGSQTFVTLGTTNAGSNWWLATADPITIGTSSLSFTDVLDTLDLKTLNADGGWTFATTGTPSINIDGAFSVSGVWETSHRISSTSTGTLPIGTYATQAVMRHSEGIALSGGGNSDVALWTESRRTNHLTSTALGQTIGNYIVTEGGRFGDHAALLVDSAKVYPTTGTYPTDYSGTGMIAECISRRVTQTGTNLSRLRLLLGFQTEDNAGWYSRNKGIAFYTEEINAHGAHSAFWAGGRGDESDTSHFEYAFFASTHRASGVYLHITGPNHADGAGRLRVANGTAALPSLAALADTDTGIFFGANSVGISAGGTVRLTVTDTLANFAVPIQRGGTQVVNTRKTGWTTVPTGTATRTTFATSTVTLEQLAERVKALIDDLHATAGHGLIGA